MVTRICVYLQASWKESFAQKTKRQVHTLSTNRSKLDIAMKYQTISEVLKKTENRFGANATVDTRETIKRICFSVAYAVFMTLSVD